MMDDSKVYKRIKRVVKSSDETDSGKDSSAPKFSSICVNPLDRLCDLLLTWNLREDLASDSVAEKKARSILQKVPTVFREGYASYLRVYEPFLIEEMKASVMSRLGSKPFSLLQKGYTYIYQETTASSVMPIIQLTCNRFFWNPGNICSLNNSAYKGGTTLAIMDLVFISLDNCDSALSTSPFYAANADLASLTGKPGSRFLLGVVTSRTKTYSGSSSSSGAAQSAEHRGYTYNIHVSRSQWEAFKQHRKLMQQEMKAAGRFFPPDVDATSTSPSAIASSAAKANICVLDGLTSSWREYLALHQMHGSPMLPFTLDPLYKEPDATLAAPGMRISSVAGTRDGCGGDDCTPPGTPVLDLTEESEQEREREAARRAAGSRGFQLRNADGTEWTKRATVPGGADGASEAEVAGVGLTIALPRQYSGDMPCFSPLSVSPPPDVIAAGAGSGKTVGGVDRVATMATSKTSTPVVQNRAVISNSFRQISSRYSKIFTSSYNKSQLTAIEVSCGVDDSGELSDSGFVLIQGPPGTGKTHTVLGMLNTLHLKQYNSFYARVVREVLGSRGLACRRLCKAIAGESEDPTTLSGISQWLCLLSEVSVQHKPHVLVTAPSNTAIDNICSRIVAKGFVDGNGSQYFPYIVRAKANANANAASGDSRTILLEEATERIVGLSLTQREALKRELSRSIRQLLTKLCHTQTLLLVLAATYNEWYVQHCTVTDNKKSVHAALRGYELRVDSQTAKPYWVDHVRQISVPHPSASSTGRPPATQFPDYSVGIDALPEYRLHTQALSHLVDQIVLANIKHKRLVAIREIETGALGPAQQKGGASSAAPQSKSYEIRKIIEQSIMQEAHLVMTTLNSVGLSSLDDAEFHTVVVDEAGQCVEPSVLIPLSRVNCRRAVLVGDPMQLPATLFSTAVRQCGYDTSLLERLIKGGHEVHLLNTQYRMIPEISEFPSTMFYGGRLMNGGNVCAPGYRPRFIRSAGAGIDFRLADGEDVEDERSHSVKSNTNHNANLSLQQPKGGPGGSSKPEFKSRFPGFVFFDLLTSQDRQLQAHASSSSVMSRSNPEEAKLCLAILQALLREIVFVGDVFSVGHVGVITPYQEQVNVLSALFRRAGYFPADGKTKSFAVPVNVPTTSNRVSSAMAQRSISRSGNGDGSQGTTTTKYITIESIDFNSVDGFQGREKDVVIISCVRANDDNSIGFLSDQRRMNVVLTRARFGLYVVGSQDTLRTNAVWSQLIQHAEDHRCLVEAPHADVDIAGLLEGHLEGKPPTVRDTALSSSEVTSTGAAASTSAAASSTSCIDRLIAQSYANAAKRERQGAARVTSQRPASGAVVGSSAVGSKRKVEWVAPTVAAPRTRLPLGKSSHSSFKRPNTGGVTEIPMDGSMSEQRSRGGVTEIPMDGSVSEQRSRGGVTEIPMDGSVR